MQYKSLLKKRTKRDEDDEEVAPPTKSHKDDKKIVPYTGNTKVLHETYTEPNYGEFKFEENVIKKIDYDSLELLLYQNRISDYHDLVDKINLWAVNLGFLVKLRRPPKMNADGSKTMRVYCSSYRKDGMDVPCSVKTKTDEDSQDVKNPENS